ncbi:hypothetical protein LCGC14_0223360 [marine sediment metagenome]|uniref:Uncharacterized protein n=1 Tax=marine sediment metagenome TaxID=412755 RepID=A0A0F9XFV7_9ZZZZ|nr:hypothetical protein [bacterium]
MVKKLDKMVLCTLAIMGLRTQLSNVSNSILDFTLGEREDLYTLKKQIRANTLYFDVVNNNCHLTSTLTKSIEKLFLDINQLDIEWDAYVEFGKKRD